MCALKRKLTGKQQASEGEHVSLAIEKKLPPKLKDPGPHNETNIVIQLVDRSSAYPYGVIEDVLVCVDNLVFPADFYVLDIEKSETPLILLGRPFLKIARAKINTFDDSVSLEFDGEICKFNIYNAMKYPSDDDSVCHLDVVDSVFVMLLILLLMII
ncbi:hypothetical protein GH714_019339 [Hevea brasiliensis]|uniref:Reverse transcriptase domain-containing protein n=1 Tax=Hevea brasiliensis TaxID=3981 RepID=A0A6A6LEZ7_HEVBR|nr:hypothetical protein GH714_019339 [Hevea brasiliensis]